MASYYVWSGAAGAGTGADWTNAYLTMTAALATKLAGDVFYVAHDHSESTAGTLGLSGTGTAPLPQKIICVDRAGSVPPVSADRRATAQIATTVNNTITITGYSHWDGIIFVAGNSTGAATINPTGAASASHRYDNCSFRIGSTGAGYISVGAGVAGGTYAEFNNTTFSFSAVSQTINVLGIMKWRNTASALIGAQVPTVLLTPLTLRGALVECIGVDLSAAGSGKTLVGGLSTTQANVFKFLDCKLNASVTKSAVPASLGSTEVDFVRCGSSGRNYDVFRHRQTGTLEQETTIVRTGGASDGTTPISWKVITTANCSFSTPFVCPSIAIWVDTTGSAVTATVECIGAAIATDAEVWVDVEYLGDASSPQGSFVNDARSNLLVTAANQTASSETWGGSTAAFKLAVTFTPQQKGWIYARVMVGKASSTFYVDPLVTLS